MSNRTSDERCSMMGHIGLFGLLVTELRNENKEEISYITHDLLMELLSFGNNVKVLKPKLLANEVKAAHQRAFEQY